MNFEWGRLQVKWPFLENSEHVWKSIRPKCIWARLWLSSATEYWESQVSPVDTFLYRTFHPQQPTRILCVHKTINKYTRYSRVHFIFVKTRKGNSGRKQGSRVAKVSYYTSSTTYGNDRSLRLGEERGKMIYSTHFSTILLPFTRNLNVK